jgi:ribosome-associated toxin RatA of RatAB toxin-antitoxin module
VNGLGREILSRSRLARQQHCRRAAGRHAHEQGLDLLHRRRVADDRVDDRIPRFMPEVRTSKILERTDDRAVVEQEAVARFMMFSKRVHLVLEVEEAQAVIRFRDRCGRSFARYEGSWTLVQRDGSTDITYQLSANPSFDVPEFLLKRLFKRDATQMIERLTAEIALRARQPN